MSKDRKLMTGMILGAAAGVAATMFFKSEKGKKLTKKVTDTAVDFKDATTEVLSKEMTKLQDKSQALSSQAKTLASSITKHAKEFAEGVSKSMNGSVHA